MHGQAGMTLFRWGIVKLVVLGLTFAGGAAAQDRMTLREMGATVGVLPPGALNAITDVPGVRVGQVTLIEGDSINTGVTAVLPPGSNVFQRKVPAAVVVGNLGVSKFTLPIVQWIIPALSVR